MSFAKKLEQQQLVLEGVDSDLLNKKVAIASAQRELNVLSVNNMYQSMHNNQLKVDVNPPAPPHSVRTNANKMHMNATYPPQPQTKHRSPVSISSPPYRSPVNNTNTIPSSSTGAGVSARYTKPPDGQQIVMRDEIEKARRVLDQSKSNNAQTSSYYQTVVQTQEFIHAETDFLNRIRKTSPNSNNSHHSSHSNHSHMSYTTGDY